MGSRSATVSGVPSLSSVSENATIFWWGGFGEFRKELGEFVDKSSKLWLAETQEDISRRSSDFTLLEQFPIISDSERNMLLVPGITTKGNLRPVVRNDLKSFFANCHNYHYRFRVEIHVRLCPLIGQSQALARGGGGKARRREQSWMSCQKEVLDALQAMASVVQNTPIGGLKTL